MKTTSPNGAGSKWTYIIWKLVLIPKEEFEEKIGDNIHSKETI